MTDVLGGGVGGPAPRTVGDGRYRLGSLIGRGATAGVFRAYDAMLGRPVAIKIFPADGGEAERRWREVRTLARMNHPGLVAVYDVGEDNGRSFFVLQLIEGHDLAARLATGPLSGEPLPVEPLPVEPLPVEPLPVEPLPVEQALTLGATLAGGLAHVHRHGVVHRDVKPANVLLDVTGRAYLSDFGIAVAPDATVITAAGTVIGTASYLAPEQVTGQPVGPPADVYALGLVLLECLTGHREYPGDPVEAANARLQRAPDIPGELPSPVRTVLAAMTASAPTDRPSAASLARHLGALLAATTDTDTTPPANPDPPAVASASAAVGFTGPAVASTGRGAAMPLVHLVSRASGRAPVRGRARPPRRPQVASLAASTVALAIAGLVTVGLTSGMGPGPTARADPPTLPALALPTLALPALAPPALALPTSVLPRPGQGRAPIALSDAGGSTAPSLIADQGVSTPASTPHWLAAIHDRSPGTPAANRGPATSRTKPTVTPAPTMSARAQTSPVAGQSTDPRRDPTPTDPAPADPAPTQSATTQSTTTQSTTTQSTTTQSTTTQSATTPQMAGPSTAASTSARPTSSRSTPNRPTPSRPSSSSSEPATPSTGARLRGTGSPRSGAGDSSSRAGLALPLAK